MYLKIYKFKARYENKYKETISYENKDDYKATAKILLYESAFMVPMRLNRIS